MKMKKSLVTDFTIFVTIGVLLTGILLSTVFIMLMRTNSDREIERFTILTTENLQSRIEARLNEYSIILDFIALGAFPLMARDQPDTAAIQDYFRIMAGTHPDVLLVFGSSYVKWTEPGGFMEYSSGYVQSPEYDNTQRGWFNSAINDAGQNVFTNPYLDTQSQQIVVSLVRAIIDRQKIVGVVGIDISLTALDEMVNAKSAMDEISSYILHSTGKYISNQDISLIMEGDFFEDHSLEEYRQRILSPNPFLGRGSGIVVSSLPIPKANWTVTSIIPITALYKEVNEITVYAAFTGIIANMCLLVLLMLYIRKKIRPINVISMELKEIAEGEGDLTKEIHFNSKDEIGELSYYFNMTLEKIKNLVLNIKNEAAILNSIGTDLASNMNETAASVNEITANIQSIKARALNQSASVSETHATMEQLVVNINKLDGLVEKQTSNVSNASIGRAHV